MPNAKSSSAKPLATHPSRDRTRSRSGAVAPDALDQDALDAIDFARRGRPEGEIDYSDDAPKLTEAQLAEFEPATFRFTKRRG